MKKLIAMLALLCLLPLALGQSLSPETTSWHNDEGNDSCIIAYSDKAVYLTDRANPIIEPVIKVVNDCGRTVTGNLGLFFQTKDMAVNLYSVERAIFTIPIVLSKNYACSYTSAFDEKTGVGTCYKEDVNGNSVVFERPVDKLEEKTFYWTETYESPQFFGNIAKQEVPVLSPNKEGFEKRASYPAMHFNRGETYLRLGMNLPKGTLHRHGYFIVTIEDSSEKSFKTVLDPEWWETGEYVADVNTVAMWHCNDSAGTTVTDETGNFDGTASNALIWDTNNPKWGAGACGLDALYYFSNGTLFDDGMPAQWTIETWFYPRVTFQNPMTHSRFWNKTNITGSDYINTWIDNTGLFLVSVYGNSVFTNLLSSKNTWASNTWFHIMIVNDGTTMALFIDGAREITGSFTTQPRAGTQDNFSFGTYAETGNQIPNALFDEIVISDANRFAIPPSFPITSIVDVNLSKIEGLDFSGLPFYSYFADENLTIDFNIFDPFNDRIEVDINYSTSAVQGTGTPFYTDLNLTLQFCDILDWNETNAVCSIDWNIMGLGDNNYYILISAAGSSDADFSASAVKVGIDNNAPVYISISPFGDSFIFRDAANFWVYASDSYSGLHNCNYTSYFNGVPGVNKTADFNASGFCPVTELLGDAGSSAFVRYYSISDHAGNTALAIHNTGTLTRAFSYLADPENILDRDIGRAISFFGFAGLQAIGMAAGLIIIFLVVKKLLLG